MDGMRGLFNFFPETLSLFKRWAFFVNLLHCDDGHNNEDDVDKTCRADDMNHEKGNKLNSDRDAQQSVHKAVYEPIAGAVVHPSKPL